MKPHLHPGYFFAVLAGVLALSAASVTPVHAHSLDTRSTSIQFADDYVQLMSQRATLGHPLLQDGDEFWVLLKTTPGPGTPTGVGGYQTFYVPDGAQVIDVAYVLPDPSDPRGFREIPMKGQSAIAIGSGSAGASSTPELIGWDLPGVNGLGIKSAPVTAAGVDRGTIAGMYADTGVFYSTDPRTEFNSYGMLQPPLAGGPSPMVNNSGDTVGEYWAANVTDSQNLGILGVMTEWDAQQLRAYGSKTPGVSIVDPGDNRGNLPWGLGNAVAGPQSGYAWEFDMDTYNSTVGTHAQKMRAAIKIGPWHRIKYPGSQISSDTPGLASSVIGNVGIDASTMGIEPSEIPDNINAIRFAIGQIELGRPEYSAVKIKVKDGFSPNLCGHLDLYGDAFGGDAGGTSGGKDHIWRYFDPTVHTLNPCALLQKTVSKTLVAPGETFYYTITFANNGTTPMPNVSIVDTLPTGIVHVSATPSPSTSAAPTYTWNLGTVAPNAVVTITQYVRATGTGTLYNTATAYSGTQVVGRAQQSVEVGTRAVILKEKSVTPSTAQPGGSVEYTLTVENVGTGPNGVPMVVRDYLPPGFTYGSFVSATLNGAAIASPVITVNSSTPAVPFFTVTQAIQPGKKLIIKFNASIGAGVTPGTYWNQFEVDYEGKRISPIPEAPVIIGGGQIGDFVWRDWNGNGVQDPGEEGLPGVTMRLYASDGTTLLQTKVTGADGSYLFSGLDAGTYVVKVHSGVPAGYTLTGDPDVTVDGEHTVNLAFNQTYTTADFGYHPSGTGSIGDQIFEDVGNDGIYNAGPDTGIGGVTVSLYKDSNNDGVYTAGVDPLVATTTSNGSGVYTFSGLPQGFSYLALVNPADSALATHFGVDPYQASTPNPRVIANLSGAYVDADFGFWEVQPATIGDQVFIDANGNGIYDAGDSPLANVTVTLLRDNAPIATTVSGPDGIYLFTNLGPGTYTVNVDTADTDIPAGYAATTASHNVTVSAGQSHLTADFPFVSVFSKVVNKTYAPPGDTLTYTITPNWPGSGALSNVQVRDPIPAGTTFGSAGQGGSNNAGTVTWNLGSTTAATNGTNTISSGGGAITYVASETATANSATSVTINRPTGTVQSNVMVAAIFIRNSNTVITPPAGWTQIRSDTEGSGDSTLTMRTYYKVAGASEPANYQFSFANSRAVGAISTYSNVNTTNPINVHGGQTTSSTTNAVTAPSVTTTVNNARLVGVFGMRQGSATYTPPGGMTERIDFGTGAGAQHVSMSSADQAFATAGATGTRVATASASNPNIGQLIALTPVSGPSYSTTTALSASRSLVTTGDSITVTLTLTATGTNVPATISAPTLNVSGTGGASATFGAATPAGPQSLTSGVPVVFTYTSTSVTAGANAGGVLTFKATPSDTNGTWAEGTANTTLVTPPLTWVANIISPNPGVNVVDNIASFYNGPTLLATDDAQTAVSASIGDFVWADLDMDGVQDAGEFGLAGVTVRLFASDGTTLLQSAVTDSTGHYRFYGVAPGSYVVSYNGASAPAGYVATTAVTVPVTITSGQQFNDADFGLAPLPVGTGSIGDQIWIDANNNGVQDDGELPLANIGLSLERWNGSIWLPTASTVSDADGFYEFAALTAGTYRVVVDTDSQITSPYASGTFSLGSAMAPTYDLDGLGTPNVASVVLPNDSTAVDNLDFGYNWSGTIGDYVWWDDNTNSVQDEAADRGIDHARVQLYFDADGDGVYSTLDGDYEIMRVYTDANGYYAFNNLPPGRYFVDVYEDSLTVDGIRNVVPTTADVIHRILGPGQSSLDNDFGYFIGARVEANVFWDRNGNGILDGGESLLSGVTVTLSGTDTFGNPVNVTADTDSNGNVVFLVPEGNYTISYSLAQANDVYPALGVATTVTSFEFFAAAGEDGFRSFDFGIDNTGAISGTVYGDIDGNGPLDNGDPHLPGVTVNLYLDVNGDGIIDFDDGDQLLAIAVTDALGNYSFTGLEDTTGNAKYVVEIVTSTLGGIYQTVPTGYPFGADTATSRYSTDLTDGAAITDIDFGYPLVPENTYYSISGIVYNDNGDGGGTVADGTQNGTEPGIPGVSVVIQVDADNDNIFEQSLTVITGPSGNYSLGGILEGSNVRVTVNPATLPSSAFGQTGDPDGAPLSNVFNITNLQESRADLDFGYREVLATVSGTVVKDANGNGIAENGEAPVEGVTVVLIYAGPDNIIGTSDDVEVTTQTAADGTYSFSGVVPGVYQVVKTNPPGFASQADRDGFDPTIINLVILPGDPLTGVADSKTGQDFEIDNRGDISGRVMLDTDLDGTGDTPLEGVTLTLVDANGDPVLDDNDNPITTTTAADGTYSFNNVLSGTYGVRMTPVTGAIGIWDADGGLVDWIGDITDIILPGGGTSPDNDFLLRTQACPNTWEAWQDNWDLDNETPTGNDDGDIHSNLVEYAFCLPPDSGKGTPYCMSPSLEAVDKVDLVFRRTAEGTLDVTYEIEHAATLGAASTTWTTVAIPPANMVVTRRTDGTDMVRVTDLESITGLASGTGFVRMKVTLRDEDDQVVAVASTDVGGWIQTPLDYEVRSFNDPFLDCPIFTGTITAVEGQDIVTETSGGGINYNAEVTAQPSYAEILTGPLQGHRFDIAAGGVNRFTAAVDNDIFSGTAPFNTVSAPQAELVGAQFVVRPHRTVGSVFPARAYVPTDDPETASVVQMYAGDRWETLWLYNDGGGEDSVPAWVGIGDSNLVDRSGEVLVPGQGGFIYSRKGAQPGASFMLFGKVRPNDFVRPLRTGLSNVGGGYPLVQTPDGRAMTPSANGFQGDRDFKKADQFLLWRGDVQQTLNAGYDTYFMIAGTPARPLPPNWVFTGDVNLAPQNAVQHFKPDYSILLKRNGAAPNNRMPSPWKP